MTHKPIRVGLISVLDRDAETARVTFPDLDDLVTDFLPIIRKGGKSWAQQDDLPEVEDHVLVVFLSSSMSDGFIIGGYKLEDSDAPLTTDQFGTVFEDGSFAYYDRAAQSMVMHSAGSVIITGGNVTVTAQNVILESENVQITGDLNVSGTITGGGL